MTTFRSNLRAFVSINQSSRAGEKTNCIERTKLSPFTKTLWAKFLCKILLLPDRTCIKQYLWRGPKNWVKHFGRKAQIQDNPSRRGLSAFINAVKPIMFGAHLFSTTFMQANRNNTCSLWVVVNGRMTSDVARMVLGGRRVAWLKKVWLRL